MIGHKLAAVLQTELYLGELMTILAVAGAGKSTALREYAARRPARPAAPMGGRPRTGDYGRITVPYGIMKPPLALGYRSVGRWPPQGSVPSRLPRFSERPSCISSVHARSLHSLYIRRTKDIGYGVKENGGRGVDTMTKDGQRSHRRSPHMRATCS